MWEPLDFFVDTKEACTGAESGGPHSIGPMFKRSYGHSLDIIMQSKMYECTIDKLLSASGHLHYISLIDGAIELRVVFLSKAFPRTGRIASLHHLPIPKGAYTT